jgi:hypothetical protein
MAALFAAYDEGDRSPNGPHIANEDDLDRVALCVC